LGFYWPPAPGRFLAPGPWHLFKLQSQFVRILDVGCGINKLPGSIGIDRNTATKADVLVDVDHIPYPFRDSSFDKLQAVHVIEHVSDVIRTM